MASIHAKDGYKAEEYFVISNNKNGIILNQIKKHLNLFKNNYYFVRVSGNKYSQIAKQLVSPKSDVYLIESDIPLYILEHNEFLLTEDILANNNIKYKKIEGSGISIKKDDAKTIQYQKFSVNSFETFMEMGKEARILGACASIYVMKDDEIIIKNTNKVLKNWSIDENDILQYFNFKIKNELMIPENKDILKKIKNQSKDKIKKIITNDNYKMDTIFFGKNNFEEPYIAHWIYKDGEFEKNKYFDFTVDAGSGRSTIDLGGK